MEKLIKHSLMLTLSIFTLHISAQNAAPADKVKWYSFEEAAKMNETNPKKVFIDVYTDWCGWCKVLDKNTFSNPVISKILIDNFYAVKLDAERKDTVVFNGHSFVNPNPTGTRSTHELASSMLQGKMSYPSMVFFNEKMQFLTTVQGYLKPEEFEPILSYFASDKYLTMKYDSFKLTFISKIVIAPEIIKPVVLNKVVFACGKSELLPSAFPQLDSLVSVMKANTKMKIEIGGHADNTGNAIMNKHLSKKRAKAVYDYIVSKGVEAKNVTHEGYGSANPIADNATLEGQQINRRIEVKVISYK